MIDSIHTYTPPEIKDIIFQKMKNDGVEFRMLYLPQALIVHLREMIINQGERIHSESAHNNLYIVDLHKHFKKIWAYAANQLLDKLEQQYQTQITIYHQQLIRYIDTIKDHILLWDTSFALTIEDTDNQDTLRSKLRSKKEELRKAANHEGIRFIIENRLLDNISEKLILTQINNMTYIAIEYITEDTAFLETIIHHHRQDHKLLETKKHLGETLEADK